MYQFEGSVAGIDPAVERATEDARRVLRRAQKKRRGQRRRRRKEEAASVNYTRLSLLTAFTRCSSPDMASMATPALVHSAWTSTLPTRGIASFHTSFIMWHHKNVIRSEWDSLHRVAGRVDWWTVSLVRICAENAGSACIGWGHVRVVRARACLCLNVCWLLPLLFWSSWCSGRCCRRLYWDLHPECSFVWFSGLSVLSSRAYQDCGLSGETDRQYACAVCY